MTGIELLEESGLIRENLMEKLRLQCDGRKRDLDKRGQNKEDQYREVGKERFRVRVLQQAAIDRLGPGIYPEALRVVEWLRSQEVEAQ